MTIEEVASILRDDIEAKKEGFEDLDRETNKAIFDALDKESVAVLNEQEAEVVFLDNISPFAYYTLQDDIDEAFEYSGEVEIADEEAIGEELESEDGDTFQLMKYKIRLVASALVDESSNEEAEDLKPDPELEKLVLDLDF